MCDRCYFDMLMYGEPVRHDPPVWEKGRFQSQAVEKMPQEEEGGSSDPATPAGDPGNGSPEAGEES